MAARQAGKGMTANAGKGRMDFIDIGWREGLLLGVVVVAVYLVVALLGLARLKRRREFVVAAEPPLAAFAPPSAPSARFDDVPTEIPIIEIPDEPTAGASAEPHPSDFARHLAAVEVEAEVRQLRADVAALRQELQELKSERTPRRVSPLYAEAAALAERGFDARGVAEECGISVAEAELVLAMNRDEKTFDNEDDHDGTRYAASEPARR